MDSTKELLRMGRTDKLISLVEELERFGVTVTSWEWTDDPEVTDDIIHLKNNKHIQVGDCLLLGTENNGMWCFTPPMTLSELIVECMKNEIA